MNRQTTEIDHLREKLESYRDAALTAMSNNYHTVVIYNPKEFRDELETALALLEKEERMNLRTIETSRLIDLWMNKTSKFHVSDYVWDELFRRCKGNPIKPELGGTGHYHLNLSMGCKVIRYEIPCNAKDLDAEFLETSPQVTDSLAFEPSDELDAATLAQ